MRMTSQFVDMTSSAIFFTLFLLSSLITGPSFMTISSQVLELWQFPFIRKGLTRNHLEIGNTPVWVFRNIWRLGKVRNTKFGKNVSNKILLDAAKCQSYSFYLSWVIKGKPTGGRGVGDKITPPPSRLGLKSSHLLQWNHWNKWKP